MPYEVFRKNFFAHMNELEITPGKVRLDEAIRLIVCQMSDFLVPYVITPADLWSLGRNEMYILGKFNV